VPQEAAEASQARQAPQAQWAQQTPETAGHTPYERDYEYTPEAPPAPPAAAQERAQAQAPRPVAEADTVSAPAPEYTYAAGTQPSGPQVTVPVGPGRRRALGNSNAPVNGGPAYLPPQRAQEQELFVEPEPAGVPREYEQEFIPEPDTPHYAQSDEAEPVGIPDGVPRDEFYFLAYRQFVAAQASFPNARQLSRSLHEGHGVTNADGSLLSEGYLRNYMREFKERYNTEMGLAG
jgi:hypothetical protein